MDASLIKEETYKGYNIWIGGRFIKDHYDFYEGYTDAVRLYYRVINPEGEEIFINKDYQYETVVEEKEKRFLFWKIKPPQTFRELVENEVDDIISYVKKKIDKRLLEKEMTDGLMENLKRI